MQKSLKDFVKNEIDELLYYSNWYNSFYNACLNNGIDPDELMKKPIPKSRRRK